MTAVLELLQQLINCPSITPNDAGCQKIIAERLKKLNFHCESMPFGNVSNLWARLGTASPLFVFAGHTDVVPTGPEKDWKTKPFEATCDDEYIYGRGTSDMKAALAAMVIAVENFFANKPSFNGSIGFLITSDEEGPSIDGTRRVIEELNQREEKIDYCLIGEPSSIDHVGDQIRIGRRGSLHGSLVIHGKQGHVAYPELVINPIHKSLASLHELAHTHWDDGNEDFPPTTFQITNIQAGTGAANVVPGHLELLFNFRFSTAITMDELQQRVQAIIDKIGLEYNLTWTLGAEPFLPRKGKLLTATESAIQEISKIKPILSTGGGTSDGRFFAATGAEVVELGVSHATAHHVNERIRINDVEVLSKYYQRILTLVFE